MRNAEQTAEEYREWLIDCLHTFGHDELIALICPYGETESVKFMIEILDGKYRQVESYEGKDDFTFAGWLESELKARDMKAKQLSEMTGITEASLSHYRKSRRNPNIATMNNILNTLGKKIVIVDKDERVIK